MKRLGKPIFIILALLILVFSVLSVSGYSYYTGDLKNTVFKGFGSLDWGNDVSGGTKVAVRVSSDDEVGYIDDVKSVIRERAAYLGLLEYDLYTNGDDEVVLVVPDDVNSDFDSQEVAAFLTSIGNLTLRPGNGYESLYVDSSNSVAYSDPTDETILIDSSYVSDASYSTYTESGVTYNYVNVTFNKDGADRLSQMSNPDTGAYYNQTVSAWLDDRMLGSQTVSSQIVSGVFSFSNEGMTDSVAHLISAVIKSGTMPCDLYISYYDTASPSAGADVFSIIRYAGFVSLIAIAAVMLYKYRAGGVLTLLSLFMQFSGILAILTGFTGEGHTFLMTIPALCALVLSVMLTVFSCGLICEKTRDSLNKGNILSKAFDSAYNDNKNKILDLNVVLALVSLMGMFVFGKGRLNISLFGTAAASGIYNFAYVLLLGSLLNIINGFILPKLMFRSMMSYKVFNKASMFGGADNEK